MLASRIAPMPEKLVNHSPVVAQGLIYIVGGRDHEKSKRSILCYDPFQGDYENKDLEEWTRLSYRKLKCELTLARDMASTLATNDGILVFGGFVDEEKSKVGREKKERVRLLSNLIELIDFRNEEVYEVDVQGEVPDIMALCTPFCVKNKDFM